MPIMIDNETRAKALAQAIDADQASALNSDPVIEHPPQQQPTPIADADAIKKIEEPEDKPHPTPEAIAAAHAVIEKARAIDPNLPDPTLPWAISYDAVTLIAKREGLKLKAYKCPAGVWTIGWGETDGVRPGMVWTKNQADERLCDEIKYYAGEVIAMCTSHPNTNELGALVSLAYNIGLKNDEGKRGLYYTSVLRLHNEGKTNEAANAFKLLNKARDPATKKLVVLRGLTVRRAQEAALYLEPEPDEVGTYSTAMPQVVEKESSLTTSPIAVTSTTIGAASVFGVVKDYIPQTKEAMTGLSDIASGIGIAPLHLMLAAVAAGCGIILYQRFKQRHDGWA